MRKNKFMRAAGGLMVLTLITSCFVSGTFAKYVTKAEGTDTARVAKFGITLTTKGEAFGKTYQDAIVADSSYTVKSTTDDKVVAPGTKGSIQLFDLKVTNPEVAVRVAASLNVGDNTLKRIKLPADTYTDYTKTAITGADEPTFNLEADYYPIVWTLSKGDSMQTPVSTKAGDELEDVGLDVIDNYLTAEFSGDYYPEGSDLGEKHLSDLKALEGNYTLSWKWAFENEGMDAADTFLGNVIAGKATASGALTTEAYKFSISVTQID